MHHPKLCPTRPPPPPPFLDTTPRIQTQPMTFPTLPPSEKAETNPSVEKSSKFNATSQAANLSGDFNKKSDCMLVPKWLAYALLLSRSIFTQKALILLFLIISMHETRQTILHLSEIMLNMVRVTCTVWETHTNSLVNLHVKFVRNMTKLQVETVNSAATGAFNKSLEGLELTYTVFLYAIQKYFYAEKCLAIGVISTALDFSMDYSDFFGKLEGSVVHSVSDTWNKFLDVIPGDMSQLKIPSDFAIPRIENQISGDEFSNWWLEQETSVKERLNPISFIRDKLPVMPLEVLREDMFRLPNTISVTFCDQIQWNIIENATRALLFLAVIALVVLSLIFAGYLLGSVGYAYWKIRREVKHEKVYSLSLMVDCGIFNWRILWKHFICHSPSLSALFVGIIGLSTFLTLDKVLVLRKDSIRDSAVSAINQSIVDALRPIDQISDDMSLQLSNTLNGGMEIARQQISAWQSSLLEWSEAIGQGQQQIEESIQDKVVSNVGNGAKLFVKNIGSTFRCLTTLFTNSLDVLRRIATFHVAIPQLSLDFRLINTQHISEQLSSNVDRFLKDITDLYTQRIRKQIVFYAILCCVGAIVPLAGILVYTYLVWEAWFRRF